MRKVIMLMILLIEISTACFGVYIDDDEEITLDFLGPSWPIDLIFAQEPDDTEAFLKCWPLKVLPDLQREKFFGNVSQIVESVYSYKQSFESYSYSDDTLKEMSIFTYDINGNRIGDVSFYINESGIVTSRFLAFIYNTEKQIEGMLEFEYFDNSSSMSKALFLNKRPKMLNCYITLQAQYELFVDDKRKPLKKSSDQYTNFYYDNAGKVIEKNVIIGQNNGTETDYIYSDKENKVRVNVYNPDRKTIKLVRIYTADSQNNIIEISEYNGDGSLRNTMLADYDDKGNISSIKKYDSKGEVNYESKIFEYFPEDNMLRVGYIDESDPDIYQYYFNFDKYYFNDIGLVNSVDNARGRSFSYFKNEYEYDTKGNWIKKVIRKQEEKFNKLYWVPYEVITRKISY